MKTINIRGILQLYYKKMAPINVPLTVKEEWPRIVYHSSRDGNYRYQTEVVLLGTTQTQVYNNVFWPLFHN